VPVAAGRSARNAAGRGVPDRQRKNSGADRKPGRQRDPPGAIIDVSLTVSPIRDAFGRIVGASKIGRDITQQKRAMSERLEADRRKDEFLAMLAHELRNPLASIDSAVRLFGRLDSQEEFEWAKQVVQRHVKHLARLIDDLLDISRITRGKITLRRDTLDLSSRQQCRQGGSPADCGAEA
jgi:two-component system CheB/CheR fusion protein